MTLCLNCFTFIAGICLSFVTGDIAIAQTCPTCSTTTVPLPGTHGAASDGRRIITIYVDNSAAPYGWGNPLPAALVDSSGHNQGAVDRAIAAWNNGTDGSGNKTCYFLQLTTDFTTADIYIQPVDTAAGGCGSITVGAAPRNMQITRTVVSTYGNGNNNAQIVGLISHEIGHALGLAESGSGCGAGATVMTGWEEGSFCVQRTFFVQASDIAKSNQNCTNRASCDGGMGSSAQQDPIVPSPTCLMNNSCQSQQFYSVPGVEPDPCGYPSNSGCPDYLISVQGSSGACCTPAYSPIIIDLAGTGYNLTDNYSGVDFDLWGVNDGSKQHIAWTSAISDNAFLVLDRNHDGEINGGLELFGDRSMQPSSNNRNGFAALAEFDKTENGGNNDGIIDERDSIFSQLRLWLDVNHNGISEPVELHSLQELGVLAISLTTEASPFEDQYGNKFRYRARITRGNDFLQAGQWAYDVFLVAH